MMYIPDSLVTPAEVVNGGELLHILREMSAEIERLQRSVVSLFKSQYQGYKIIEFSMTGPFHYPCPRCGFLARPVCADPDSAEYIYKDSSETCPHIEAIYLSRETLYMVMKNGDTPSAQARSSMLEIP